MDCQTCKDRLLDYLYSELSPQQQTEMEKHLQSCRECALEFEDLRLTRKAFVGLKDPEPPPFVETRILAHAREIKSRHKKSLFTRMVFHPATSTVALAFIVLSVAIYFMGNQFRDYRTQELEFSDYTDGTVKTEIARAPQPEALMDKDMEAEPHKQDFDLAKKEAWAEEKAMYMEAEEDASEVMTDELRESVASGALAASEPPAPSMPVSADSPAEGEPLGRALAGAESRKAMPAPGAAAPMSKAKRQAKATGPAAEMDSKFISQQVNMDTRQWDQAIADNEFLLTNLAPADPRIPVSQMNLGISYCRVGRCDKAVPVLEQLLKDHKDFSANDQVLINLADCYVKQGKNGKAHAAIEQLQEQYPAAEMDSRTREQLNSLGYIDK